MIETFNLLPAGSDEFVRAIYQGVELDNEGEDKPLVVMIHDFPHGDKQGTDKLFDELEYKFEQTGYSTVRFDFRGCGESDGRAEDFTLDSALEDLQAVLTWARNEAAHDTFVFIGEGLGASIAAMGFDATCVKALIMLWPVLMPKESVFAPLFTREARLENLKNDLPYMQLGTARLGVGFINEIYQMDLTSTLENISAPALLQHGTDDKDVPINQTYFAREHMPKLVDIGIFEGGDHGLRAANMREHLYVNIEHFMHRLTKMRVSAL